MSASLAQLRYLADAVNTASPAQRVVMLYDRMLLDIRRGGQAQQGGDLLAGAEQLRHAQQIVAELRASLRLDGWSGAENLASLYGFLLSELIQLSVTPDQGRLSTVNQIVSGLRDSWRDAAGTLVQAVTAPAADTTVDSSARQVAWLG